MKLGVAYIVFDGIELLEKSIIQIREHVDFITIIYQHRSWFGDLINPSDLKILQSLKNKGLVDSLIEFKKFIPVKHKSIKGITGSKYYETIKRQLGLKTCLLNGCTHYLCMDVDEFYISSEFKKAKKIIISNNYARTAVRFLNYVNIPIIHRGIDPNSVPFICKIDNNSKLGSSFFVRCDPTRGITNGSNINHSFNQNIITMHHMETVRKDLFKKYNSTTRKIFKRERTSELINELRKVNSESSSFSFNKIIFPATGKINLHKVNNIFNIDYKNWNNGS